MHHKVLELLQKSDVCQQLLDLLFEKITIA